MHLVKIISAVRYPDVPIHIENQLIAKSRIRSGQNKYNILSDSQDTAHCSSDTCTTKHMGLVSHVLSSYTIGVLVAFICILKKYKSQRPRVLEFSLTQPLCAFLLMTKQDIGLGDFSCIYGEMTEISGSSREFESDQVSSDQVSVTWNSSRRRWP